MTAARHHPTHSLIRAFRALGEPGRFKIVMLLGKRQGMCVNEIAEALGVSAPAASHQLRILEEAGVLLKERVGQTTCYELIQTHPAINLISEQANSRKM